MESVAALAIKVVEKQLLRGAVVRPAQAWPIRLGLGDRSHRARPGASRRRNFRAVWRSRGPAGLRWGRGIPPAKSPSRTSFQEPQKLFAMVHASGALVGRISIPCSGLSPAMIGMA